MPDAMGDEIESLVAKAKERDDDDELEEESEEEEPEPKPTKGTRVKKKRSTKSKKAPQKAKTIEEMDLEDMMPESMPKPAQSIKSLGDMYARYGVGDRPEFKVHLYRSYPKIAPGNIKFDGFYDEYNIPLTEQMIQSDYGGGQYRVVVVGPNPKNPNLSKHYESFSVGLAGEPNFDRMPRALQTPDKARGATNSNPAPLPVSPVHEHPKLAEAALKMIGERAKEDREELRRREEMMEKRLSNTGGSDALAEAERRRADDVIKAERERAEERRKDMEQRMEEMKRRQEEEERRRRLEERSRPSFGQELAHLAPLLQRDDGSTKETMSLILQKHRDEIGATQQAHAEMLRDLRSGHRDEIAALRQAHQRELEAEREASRGREERIEERLRSERAERDRDRQRHKEAMDERDRHWKDRMEGQLQMQNSSWEARHQAAVSTYESRMQWLQQEIDKLKSESYELRQKQEDKGDVFSQLTKHRELARMMKDFGGADASSSASSSSSGGGIGLSGGDDWKSTAVEGLVERAPQILEKLFSPGGAASQVPQPQPQQMQHFHEGQVVDTPQGKMEVVRNPQDGQLALAPKDALDKHRSAMARQQERGGGLLPGGGAPEAQPQRRQSRPHSPRKPSVSAVPDLSQGLPKRRAPWEGGGNEDQGPPLPPEPPPPMPRSATRSPQPVTTEEPMELSHVERQGLQLIAKEVHESVNHADEPEEFVKKMVEKYPANVLQQIVGSYTDRQIVQGIMQLQPNSAGATPAGRSFVGKAFHLLRQAVSQ